MPTEDLNGMGSGSREGRSNGEAGGADRRNDEEEWFASFPSSAVEAREQEAQLQQAALSALSYVHLCLGDHSAALAAAEQALHEMPPTSFSVLSTSGYGGKNVKGMGAAERQASLSSFAAEALDALGRPSEALTVLEESRKKLPLPPEYPKVAMDGIGMRSADVCRNLAWLLAREGGDDAGARRAAEDALWRENGGQRLAPSSALLLLAYMDMSRGDGDSALVRLRGGVSPAAGGVAQQQL